METEEIKELMARGFYTDKYFNRTKEVLEAYEMNPRVVMQVFQKGEARVCGLKQSIEILKDTIPNYKDILIYSLQDGDWVKPYETVMTIEGNLVDFVHLETVYLGILARETRICTNASKVVEAAEHKPVFFFPARFDYYRNQLIDGYAGDIAGVDSISTDAQGQLLNVMGSGTMPHALIAAFNGDTAEATVAFANVLPNRPCISLVDFENDCVKTSVEVAERMRAEGLKLHGVRLDTSGTMVDKSIQDIMGQFKPTGVCDRLVILVREALNKRGFHDTKIYVSGGFTPERIAQFERDNIPVSGYGVGSSMFKGNIDFTADIVKVDGHPCAKVGREYRDNQRMNRVVW